MNTLDRIKAVLKEKNIAISRLEKDLGYSNGSISKLKNSITTDKLMDISLYLDLPPSYFTTGELDTTEMELAENEQKIIDIFRELNEEQKKLALNIMNAMIKEGE